MSDEWKTIDSAPKDGSWILGFEKGRSIQNAIAVWFWDPFAGEEYGTGMWIDAADQCEYDQQPTHWRPLPPPPGA